MDTRYLVVLADGRFLTHGGMLGREYPDARLFDSKREATACAKAIDSSAGAVVLTTKQYAEEE